MPLHPSAGTPAQPVQLTDIAKLVTVYYANRPDPRLKTQRVSFGTSGHRGSSLSASFNQTHILAITQAICDYRRAQGINGPLYIAKDTHALSEPAFVSALEVLAANDVEVMIDADLGYTPTPALSHAILTYNRNRSAGLADGIVITPSHNPPEDGGFKYNPPNGGPADTSATKVIEAQANDLIAADLRGLKRIPYERALSASSTHRHDFISAYVNDLGSVIDLEAVRSAGLRLGVDPLGGAGVRYWGRIEEKYRIGLQVLNEVVDPTFRFMTLDWDGRLRMLC
jgi:phosphoglucomutase